MEHAQILESLFSSDDLVWRLTTLELRRNFSMLFLAFLASARGLTLAGGWTSAAADLLVVGSRSVRQTG